MNESVAEVVDASMRARVQALQGVDDLVADVVDLLEKMRVLDETYSESMSFRTYYISC